MIGTFYRSSSPDKDAFVKVGDTITPGKPICIIEAMKLFNEIESEVTGKIIKVLVEDASPVGAAGPVIAMNAIRRIDATTAEIKRMRVTKDRRRQGIARLLLEIAEDYCRAAGYTRIILDTTDLQEAAKVMYTNHGYTETSSSWLEPLSTTLRYYEKHL